VKVPGISARQLNEPFEIMRLWGFNTMEGQKCFYQLLDVLLAMKTDGFHGTTLICSKYLDGRPITCRLIQPFANGRSRLVVHGAA
jgi:hypothetical protein